MLSISCDEITVVIVKTFQFFGSKLVNLNLVLIDKDAWNKEDFAAFSDLLNSGSTGPPKDFTFGYLYNTSGVQ